MESDSLTVGVKEAAKLIGCGRITAYRLCKENLLPHLRIGPKPLIRIPRVALERWLLEQAGSRGTEVRR